MLRWWWFIFFWVYEEYFMSWISFIFGLDEGCHDRESSRGGLDLLEQQISMF